jgi:putative SOS response-associated peptidase YedK
VEAVICSSYKSPTRLEFTDRFQANLTLRDGESADARWGDLIFPGYAAPIIALRSDEARVESALWGLLPRGSTDKSFWKKYATFNARVETVGTSQLYRRAWAAGQRCAIPAQWFVEWRGPKGSKERLRLSDPSRRGLLIAGLWEETPASTGPAPGAPKPLRTFTMLTVTPNEFMQSIHNRMPALLPLGAEAEWLDPGLAHDQASRLLRPYAGELAIESTAENDPQDGGTRDAGQNTDEGADSGATGGSDLPPRR